jgi:hypothetical protein
MPFFLFEGLTTQGLEGSDPMLQKKVIISNTLIGCWTKVAIT